MADRLPMEIQESFDLIDSIKKFLTPQRLSAAFNSYMPKFFANISGNVYLNKATVDYLEQESTQFNNKFVANKSAFVPIYRIPHNELLVMTPLYATQKRGRTTPGVALVESTLLYNLATFFGLHVMFSIYHNFTKPDVTITPEGKLLFTPNGYMPIICSGRVYKEFTQDERFAVYLHEMAHHVQHGTQVVSDLLRTPGRILSRYAFINYILRPGGISLLPTMPLPLVHGVILLIFLSIHLAAIADRVIELNADRFSASLGQGVYLKSALQKIEADYAAQLAQLGTIGKMLDTLGSILSYAFAKTTHPSFKQRYENIDNTKVISSERMPVPVYNVRVIDELDNKIRSALMPYDEMLSR